MQFVTGLLNKPLLRDVVVTMMDDCTAVLAAIAYADRRNMQLFEACANSLKPLEFYGRYDATVPIAPETLKWFLDKASPNLVCRLVPDLLHAKVIWWVGAGAYVGSANLTDRAWMDNIEAGLVLSQDELETSGIETQLEWFFDELAERSNPLTVEVYLEQLHFKDGWIALDRAKMAIEQRFEATRAIQPLAPIRQGGREAVGDRRFREFAIGWNETLQVMRTVSGRVSDPAYRPSWIDKDVPSGVQADQFLHAYYYKLVRDGNRHPYELFHQRNAKNPEAALVEAMEWWRTSDFDYDDEARMVNDWAPSIRRHFAKDQLQRLEEAQFVEAISRVHAVREHASKLENRFLGLPDVPQTVNDKVLKFGEWLWHQRSDEGHSVLETLEYVVWGNGAVAERLWNGTRNPRWTIARLGLSSLGEIIGWARPDEYPPRNERTSKGLRALGQKVKVKL